MKAAIKLFKIIYLMAFLALPLSFVGICAYSHTNQPEKRLKIDYCELNKKYEVHRIKSPSGKKWKLKNRKLKNKDKYLSYKGDLWRE